MPNHLLFIILLHSQIYIDVSVMLHILYYLDNYKNTCLFCPIGEIYALNVMYSFFLYEALWLLFFYIPIFDSKRTQYYLNTKNSNAVNRLNL